jgi:hypothetical protein
VLIRYSPRRQVTFLYFRRWQPLSPAPELGQLFPLHNMSETPLYHFPAQLIFWLCAELWVDVLYHLALRRDPPSLCGAAHAARRTRLLILLRSWKLTWSCCIFGFVCYVKSKRTRLVPPFLSRSWPTINPLRSYNAPRHQYSSTLSPFIGFQLGDNHG